MPTYFGIFVGSNPLGQSIANFHQEEFQIIRPLLNYTIPSNHIYLQKHFHFKSG